MRIVKPGQAEILPKQRRFLKKESSESQSFLEKLMKHKSKAVVTTRAHPAPSCLPTGEEKTHPASDFSALSGNSHNGRTAYVVIHFARPFIIDVHVGLGHNLAKKVVPGSGEGRLIKNLPT